MLAAVLLCFRSLPLFSCVNLTLHVLVVVLLFSDDSTKYAEIVRVQLRSAASHCDVDYNVYSNIDASANSPTRGVGYTEEEITCSLRALPFFLLSHMVALADSGHDILNVMKGKQFEAGVFSRELARRYCLDGRI